MSELNTVLFFKIWRNGLIKKTIYSFMINQLKYESLFIDQICSVEWMCTMNHIELLKKKVLNNEYLVFEINKEKKAPGTLLKQQQEEVELIGQEQAIDILWGRDEDDIPQDELIEFKVDNSYQDTNNKFIVFKYIKDDNQFYKSLFKNYFKCFQTNKKETLMYIIKYDCVSALQEFLKVNNYSINLQLKESYLIKSINWESFQVAEYIYKKLVIKPSAKSIFIKTIHQSKVGPIRSTSIDKRVLFLVNVLKLKVPSDLDNLQYSHNSNLMDCTIREIYNSCYCLALLKKPLSKYTKNLKKYLLSQKTWEFDSMYPGEVTKLFLFFGFSWLSFDYLETVKITQEQFNTKLINLDLNLARSLQDLEALLRMVLPFIDVINTSRYMVGFMYYNYLYRNAELIEEILFHNYYENVWLFQKTNLFSAKSRIDYVKTITEYINRNSPHTPVYRKYQRRILNCFIQVNDIASLKKVSEIMLSCNTSLSNRVFIELKENVELFDYFFAHTPSQLFKFEYLLLNSNKTILNHYKLNYNQDFKKRAGNLNLKLIKKVTPIKNFVLQFLYENLADFKEHFISIIQMWRPFDDNPNILDLTFQEFKFFVTRMDNKSCLSYFGSHINQFNHYEKFLYYKYQSYDILNYIQLSSTLTSSTSSSSISTTLSSNSTSTIISSSSTSTLNQNSNNNSSNFFLENCKLVFFEIGRRGDISTLNDIMVNYFSNENSNINYKSQLYNLLMVACHFGQIEIFSYLFKNYPWLLTSYYDDKSKDQSQNINNQIQLSHINSLIKSSKINFYLNDYLIKIFKIN